MLSSMARPPQLSTKDLLELLVSRLDEFVIVLTDTRGVFRSWNPGVESSFGYTAEEFIGQNFSLLLPRAERPLGTGERELKEAEEKGRASDTRWLETKNGERILVEGVTVGLRDDAGQLAGFGKVLRNVTQRYNVENNLRALTRALHQSNVIVRRWDGMIEHWTAGCERLYGWTAAEAVNQNVHKLLQISFPIPLTQIQQLALAAKTWTGELKLIRKDGSPVFISTTWGLLSDGGEPSRVIETHTDITARLEVQRHLENANDRLQSMARELERSNEELEEFARIASHDLSAPITSTRWLVDALRMRCGSRLEADGRDMIQQISQNLESMANLVEAVLTHARVGTTAIGTSEATDAEEALAIAIGNLRKDIELSGAAISHERLPRLRIDAQALAQLFQNLLSNSVKYRRPDTPPAIHITAVRQDSMWLVAVHDNGMGIEPEWFERIFQPFQRRRGTNVAGSGIGLATCKKIVMRAGGKIWVESKLGSGSSFFFTLPGE
jgi:PAS domain S-box-containing protein